MYTLLMEHGSSTNDGARGGVARLAVVFALLAAATWIAVLLELDLRLAALFHDPDAGWYLADERIWRLFKRFGVMPGIVLTLASLAGLLFSLSRPRLRPWRRSFWVIFLTAAIGSGLLVNTVFKPYWGRPRPSETTAFGGAWEYRHPHQMGTPGKGRSFPSGHSTMGYVFLSLLVFRHRSPRAAFSGVVFGLAMGTLLGVSRMVQGSHFATDVMWSFGIMLMVYIAVDRILLPCIAAWMENARHRSPWRRRWPPAAAALAAVLLLAVFLTHRPFYETYRYTISRIPIGNELIVETGEWVTDHRVRWSDEGDKAFFRSDTQGFGWAGSDLAARTKMRIENGSLRIVHRLVPKGYFSKLVQGVEVVLPRQLQGKMDVRFERTL